MDRTKEFLEFVTKNPPPCMPGDRLFWFNDETGEIRQSRDKIKLIALTENWEWKLIDEGEDVTLIVPNEDQYFCFTPEDAKRFRDKVEMVKYAVFNPDYAGNVEFDAKRYSFVKTSNLTNIAELKWYDDYVSTIMKRDPDVRIGTVIMFGTTHYLISAEGKLEEVIAHFIDEKSKLIVEDSLKDF